MNPKGYLLPGDYMGYIDGEYQKFETEDEYYSYIREENANERNTNYRYV